MLVDWRNGVSFSLPSNQGFAGGRRCSVTMRNNQEGIAESERMRMSKPPGVDHKARVPFKDSHYIVTPVSPSREGPGFRALTSQGLRVVVYETQAADADLEAAAVAAAAAAAATVALSLAGAPIAATVAGTGAMALADCRLCRAARNLGRGGRRKPPQAATTAVT